MFVYIKCLWIIYCFLGVDINGIFICGRIDLYKCDLWVNCYIVIILLFIVLGLRCVDKYGFY